MEESTAIRAAGLRMVEHMIRRKQRAIASGWTSQDGLPALLRLREAVAAYPDIPAGTPDMSASMNFNTVDFEYGGSAWDMRQVRIRDGQLELQQGRGLTDGMTGSDLSNNPATDLGEWLAVLDSPEEKMGGPYG